MRVSMRIMIFGRPGSGKSTFALELSQKLRLPLYHIDRYFYTHNWVERNYEEFLHIQRELVAQDQWIIDGNATKSLEMRYQRADIVLYFCYPRLKALWYILKRRFFSKKDSRIDDRAEGCHENMRWSLIKYLWTYEDRVKDKISALQTKYSQVKLYTIRNEAEQKKVMATLTQK